MKITTKTTMEEMTKYLGENVAQVKEADKDLFDRISYASKMYKKDASKVTRKDIVDLVRDTMTLLADKAKEVVSGGETLTPLAENSVKKTLKPKAKEEAPKTEPKKTEKADKEAPKKDNKKDKVEKSANKDSKKEKESGVASLNSEKSEKAVPLAESFKESFTVDGATYEIAHDIKTMEDLYKALENEETIVFAMYWSKRHLKQFSYFDGQVVAPKEFPMDLDLTTCIYVSDEGKIAYAVSMYTEGCYALLPDDLTEEDGIRFSSGIEYQIYRQTSTEEETK